MKGMKGMKGIEVIEVSKAVDFFNLVTTAMT